MKATLESPESVSVYARNQENKNQGQIRKSGQQRVGGGEGMFPRKGWALVII